MGPLKKRNKKFTVTGCLPFDLIGFSKSFPVIVIVHVYAIQYFKFAISKIERVQVNKWKYLTLNLIFLESRM